MRKLILASTLLMSVYGHSAEISPYIVNGNNADISNYPSYASLHYEDTNGNYSDSFCGATIINNEFILTAAHCLVDDQSRLNQLRVAPQLDDETNYRSNFYPRAQAVYFPSTYVNSASELWPDDIAIIRLETRLSVGNMYGKLNFAQNGQTLLGSVFRAIGHGYTEPNVEGGSKLLETELNLVSNAGCKLSLNSSVQNKLTDKQLCFDGPSNGSYKNSTCNGDSGGPVYWDSGSGYIQVGITSFGLDQCGLTTATFTSVFTDVYDYHAWIDDVLRFSETPSYELRVQNGQRVLIDHTLAAATIVSSTNDSGGSLSVISLLGLLFISYIRKRNTMRIKCVG